MTANAIIAGTFADLRSVKSRSVVVLHIEVPIEQAADVVAMFGYPQPGEEVAVAVARLVTEQSKADPAKPKREWNELTAGQQAGLLCGEVGFQRWLKLGSKDEAAAFVRDHCGVRSRSDIEDNPQAREAWNRLVGRYRDFQRYGDMVA